MSHLGARILAVLREDRPYELRNTHDEPISKEGAMELIQAEFKVPEETRQARRRRKTNQGRGRRTREAAARAPQSGPIIIPFPCTVYSTEERQSIPS